MWDKAKANKLEIDLRAQLQENLYFMERYERVVVDSIEIILNNNVVPKYKLSAGLGEAIYNAVKSETDKILVKLAVLCAGEGASVMEIFNCYALKYCQAHMQTPSCEAFEEYHCRYCAHSENCPYYLDANDNYLLKADQKEAQEYCNRQEHCKECAGNPACSNECITVDNQFAILGKPLSDSLFVRKKDFVEYKFRTEWRKYIDEVNAFCTDYSTSKMNTF